MKVGLPETGAFSIISLILSLFFYSILRYDGRKMGDKTIMNILLIGNGFDLAHGLPTKYTDFLEWIKAEYALYGNLRDQGDKIITKLNCEVNIQWAIVSFPSKNSVERLDDEALQLEIWNCINRNFWIDYFLNNSIYQRENWIDFESEISKIIRLIDTELQSSEFNDSVTAFSNKFLNEYFIGEEYECLFIPENEREPNISYHELRNILLDHLHKLIRVLEIYLAEYVEKIKVKLISEDIMKVSFNQVLSFNYTNTYEKIYGKERDVEYDYIHGKVRHSDQAELNNMVLGIDEYLSDERKNKDLEFIGFKKYFQRIHKETGCKYREWIDDIIIQSSKIHHLYIFGHSLDETDGDVLRDFILRDNIHTHIYYLNKDVYGQQITNLVKVIGQDELIRKTGGFIKKIEFLRQHTMINNENGI